MKTIRIIPAYILLAALAIAGEPLPDYEAAPMMRAADILKPEILAGPNHRVLPNVATAYGRNHYTIETPWGYLTADGDVMLMARVAEVGAIAELENVSRTDAFKQSLVAAAKTPYNVVKGLMKDPKGTIQGTGKGMMKFMSGIGQSAKELTQGRKRGQGEDSLGKNLIGLSTAKRQLAMQLGADPYSSNELFQEQLENVGWVMTAGEGAFKIATMPISGGLGMALTVTGISDNFQDALLKMSPGDLRQLNKKYLEAMGVSTKAAEKFLATPAFSPTQQTAFVFALRALGGVKNRAAFVAIAAETSTEEADAQFCSGSAQLLAAVHAGKVKLASITTLGKMPVAITEDGRLLVALQWDTAFWSEAVERFIERAAVAKLGQTGPTVVAITGEATERTRAELAKRKIALLTHALDGPQK